MAGDEALVRELYPRLRRFAAVVGPAEADPDDLVQEALARTLAARPLEELDHALAYLRRTVLSVASNQRRRMGRGRRALRALPGPEATSDVYPSDVAELLRLPPDQRAALFLAEVEGLTAGDVASVLGCSPAAVRKRLSRARAVLRAELTEEMSDD